MTTTDLAIVQPWEKRKGESARAFHYFTLYRDDPTRSLADVATIAGVSLATIQEHSAKRDWVDRREAYWMHVDAERRARREREIEQAEQQEMAAFRLATGVSLANLAGRQASAAADGTLREEIRALADRGELDAADVARLLELGFRGRRLLHGQPVDISKALDSFSAREVAAIVEPIVEAALDRMPESEHEGFVSYVREIGKRASGVRPGV